MELNKAEIKILNDAFKHYSQGIENVNTLDFSENSIGLTFPWFSFYDNNRNYRNKTVKTSPLDFLMIRENQTTASDFLGELLDNGPLFCGCKAWDQDFLETPSVYGIWMYKSAFDEKFKENFQNSLISLLEKEVEKDFLFDESKFQESKEIPYYYVQFNRLVGLLEIIESIGTKEDKGYIPLIPIMKRKLKEGFLEEAPVLDFNWSYESVDLYSLFINAYSSINKSNSNRAHKFHLDNYMRKTFKKQN